MIMNLYPAILSCVMSFGTPQQGGGGLLGWERQTAGAMQRGLAFLAASQQPDGGWIGRSTSDPAITALVTQCFVQSPDHGPDHRIAKRGIEFILRHVQPDGGVYVPDHGLRNYHTSVCLMALSATRDPTQAETIARAQAFLKKGQWDENEQVEPDNPWYGGAGYGQHKRPDLSNTQMMLEALAQSGLPSDDPVYRKALTFVTRCQMASETNDQSFAGGANDGGFIYTPANGGESKAGTVTVAGQPRLRSYGSMTYAGFKSLLYAGLSKDDARVRAVAGWVGRHYTLDANPNMPDEQSHEGLYYYYHAFARAMNAWGEETIVDAQGHRHAWREELCGKLVSLQRPDGSWINDQDRWYEGNAYLVTAYAILAIQTAAR